MSLFDGMASALNGVFGARVTITVQGSLVQEINAVFRFESREVSTAEGIVLSRVPILKAQTQDVLQLSEGDLVEVPEGRFLIEYREPATSPAVDRFETFILKKELS